MDTTLLLSPEHNARNVRQPHPVTGYKYIVITPNLPPFTSSYVF